MARIVALIVVAVLAATPAAALAASGGQGLLQNTAPQQAPPPAQTTPAPTQTAPTQVEVNSGSIGARETLLIAIGIVVLIGGIWVAISRDAKRVTAGRLPARDGEASTGRGGSATRASRRSRKLSADERRRRKRGRAR
ncbi:MAG: hypothetical protein JSS99_08220 [Actinobacteria bacterium]|nr:hypothetical protein [Actinomycetota bacterium]